MRALLPARVVRPKYKYWFFPQKVLDQGNYGTCVGHGWKHWMMTAPVRTSQANEEPTAVTIYREACHLDPWSENDNEDLDFGTSVRAGAQALQQRGHVLEYRWAFDLQTTLDFLLTTGPVVIGVNFYNQMFNLDDHGFMRVGGGLAGGHCMCLIGANETMGAVRGLNSWGREWGQRGRFWMTYSDLEQLIGEDGEIATASEQRV